MRFSRVSGLSSMCFCWKRYCALRSTPRPPGSTPRRARPSSQAAFITPPDLAEEVPDALALAQRRVVAQTQVVRLAVFGDGVKGVFRVDVGLFRRRLAGIAHVSPADAEGAQKARLLFALVGDKVQRVGVFEGKIRLRHPFDARGHGRERFYKHAVGAVALPRLGQRAVEAHRDAVGLGVFGQKAQRGRAPAPWCGSWTGRGRLCRSHEWTAWMRLLRGVLCIFQRQVFSRVFGLLKYGLAIHDPHNKNY